MLFQDLHSSDDSDNDSDYVPDKELDSSAEEENTETKSEKRNLKEPEVSPKKRNGKFCEETETDNKEVSIDKKKADDLFKSFLLECEAEMKAKEAESGLLASSSSVMPPEKEPLEENIANSSVRSVESHDGEDTKKSVEVFEFAGETVVVSENMCVGIDGSVSVLSEASNDSEREISATKKPAPNKRKGLESVLGLIDHKKKKLNVLQKSKLDWQTFKKAENIEDELRKHNQGLAGYLERKRFLERSDVRAYEIERDMRHSKNKK